MHPPRVSGFSYKGLHRYFLTFCAFGRSRPFESRDVVHSVLGQIRRSAASEQFDLLAYCFMPDHVHLVVTGLTETADLRRFARDARQRSGYWFSRRTGRRLWQTGFYDRVLRSEEQTLPVVRYVLANAVRARLAAEIGEFEFSGSDVFSIDEIYACLQTWAP